MCGQRDSQVFSQEHASRKTKHFKADYPVFHWLITGKSVDVTTCVDLVWVAYTVKKLLRLAYKFDLDQSERKSSRKSTLVHARPGQTESQVDPSFNLRPLATPFGLGLNEFWRPLKSLSSAVVVNSDPLGRDLFC